MVLARALRRGGIKAVIYNGESMLDSDLLYKAGVYDRVNAKLGPETAAQTELCQCMLTNNGTSPYPKTYVRFTDTAPNHTTTL